MADDPSPAPDKEAPDLSAKRELSLEAQRLVDDKGLFMLAVRALRRQWFAEMMNTIDRDTIVHIAAQMRALEMIPTSLTRWITDYEMAKKKASHG